MPDGSNIEDIKDLIALVDKSRELAKEGFTKNDESVVRIDKAMEDGFAKVAEIDNKARAADKSAEELTKRLDDVEKELSLAHLSAKGNGDIIRTACDNALIPFMRKGVPGDFDNAAEWIEKSVEEVAQLVTKGAVGHQFELVCKDMVAGIDPNGGFFIPPAPMQVIETKVFETSPIRPLANIVTTSTDSFDFILDDDEADSGWVGEVSSRGNTGSPTLGEVKIPVHEIFAQPRATQKMLDDAGFDLEGWLTGKVSSKFTREENTAFVAGNGALKPKGFLTYAASADANVYERDTVGQLTATGTAGTLDESDDLKSLRGLVKEEYQNSAVWGMKRATWTDVTKLADTQGRYLFDIISNLRDGDIMQLLGRPVVLMNDMPDVANNALAVVYGDFGEFYTIVDRLGIRVLRDPYTQKPFVRFYSTKRVGGAVTNYEAAKLLKINA